MTLGVWWSLGRILSLGSVAALGALACGRSNRSPERVIELVGGAGSDDGMGALAGSPIVAAGGALAVEGAGGHGDATEGAGGHGDAPQPQLPRIVVTGLQIPLTLCQDGSCAAGKRCFRMTDEFGLCDEAMPLDVSECLPHLNPLIVDECGCDGLACPLEQMCRRLEAECSCPSDPVNVCLERPCEVDQDCGDDVCVPSSLINQSGRCLATQCRSDSECSLIPGGRCAAVIRDPSQAGSSSLSGVVCIYPSLPPPSPTCLEPYVYGDAYVCRPN